jgi:hypothetical protein
MLRGDLLGLHLARLEVHFGPGARPAGDLARCIMGSKYCEGKKDADGKAGENGDSDSLKQWWHLAWRYIC